MEILMRRVDWCMSLIEDTTSKRNLVRIASITPESFYLYLDKNRINDIIDRYGPEFIIHFIKKKPRKAGRLLKFLKHHTPDAITQELASELIKKNASLIKYMSDDVLTYESCKIACLSSGSSLSYVPKKFKTQELCDIACTNTPSALKYVPKTMRNKQIAMKHALKGKSTLKYMTGVLETGS